MKQCPRCNQIYSAQLQFCIDDGSTLFDLKNSDDGPETVTRSNPIVINLEDQNKSESKPPTIQLQISSNNDTRDRPKRSYGLLFAGVSDWRTFGIGNYRSDELYETRYSCCAGKYTGQCPIN